MTVKTHRSSGNIFKDLGFSEVESESLRIRSKLMARLRLIIEERKLMQADAGVLLGVSQPRVSDLVRGKIEKFSTDMLIEMLARAGLKVTLSVSNQRRAA